jgi:toxin ParE1/3/4
MAELRWTPQAADDLEAITNFIAADSPHYASLFAIDVLTSVERLQVFPRSGRIVPELHAPENGGAVRPADVRQRTISGV